MKFIFVSPHIDDSFLSCGGIIVSLLKSLKKVDIEYIFSISDYSNAESISGLIYPRDPLIMTKIRKDEEYSIKEILKHKFRFYDFFDYPLRETPEETDKLKLTIKTQLLKIVKKTDCLFFPLGMDHPDHLVIRDIGYELLYKGHKVIFYEDMPYLTSGKYSLNESYTNLINIGLTPKCVEIDYAQKEKILTLYSSQVSAEWLRSIMNYCYNLADNCFYERYWTIEKYSSYLQLI